MYSSNSEGQTGLGLAHDSQRERRLGAAPTAAAAGSASGDFGVFDGKRVRRPLHRRTVDYTSTAVRYVQTRVWQRDVRDSTILQPTPIASVDMLPTVAYTDNPASSFTTKFVHASTNKVKYSINRVLWIPTGRRLITGLQSGEFTLWNGQSFNFEMILQAHDEAIRSMVWSHNENWMVTGDDGGCIKYWQSNMNNVKANKTAHKEAVRDLSFSSTDLKFCSCSDDTTVKVWDFARCQEERSLAGHGWDVKSVDWHPQKSLLVSGAKDSLVKLWDAKTGRELCTLHGHKNIVLSVKWNKNGNWILTASKDQIIKLYDIRTLKELESYRGHRKDVTCLAWHPFHEELFVSGSYDGTIMHWLVGHEVPQAEVANAHDSSVWDLCWHPMGHILCSGSNDHTTKFWCRNRPGDTFRDKHGTAHSQGTSGDQTLLASGRPANMVQAMEGPTTPGAFASGGPVRGEGPIPGVGMAMPLAQPSIDSGVTAESTRPQSILGEFVPSGTIPRGPHPPSAPHPSTISSGQPVYQQLQMQPQQQPLQQSQQPEQPQQQLPPHLLQQQVHLPLPPPLQPIGLPMQQQPSHAISSLGAPSSISSSEPLLSRPMLPPSSASVLMGGQVASIVPLSGPSPQIRAQLGPALGVPSMRPITGGQVPVPSQGLSPGGEFLGTVHSGQMSLSGGQAFRTNFGGLQAPIPGLMASLGGAPYSGLPGPPLPAAMTTGPHSFQGGALPTMMDVHALGINVPLPMGMGLNVPPHSHGPGPPQQ